MPPLGSKKFYAWSNISDKAKCGDEVSKSSLGCSDEQWQEWVDTGTVRNVKYPDIPNTVAPAQHYKELAAAAAEGDYSAFGESEAEVKEDK